MLKIHSPAGPGGACAGVSRGERGGEKKQDFVLNTLNMFFLMFPGCDTALWVSQVLWEGCF